MANEVATKIELFGENSAGAVMQYTVASGVAIPLGTVMALTASPRTIAAHSTSGQIFVGVANAEKDASDTSVSLGVYQNGVFKFAASGSIADGDTVILSTSANYVETDNTPARSAIEVGTAINDGAGGFVVVRINK